jgi:ornithine cyclodeaminase/alanine dehydrogenase-like protein (mu-crystallin family)
VPLYLREAEVAALVTPADAIEAVEASLRRLAAGAARDVPRVRLPADSGELALLAAADEELGYAGVKTYALAGDAAAFVVVLFETARAEAAALIEADVLGRLRTAAASAVAARFLARPGASSVGVIGCGRQARGHVAALRAALPAVDTVVAYCRDEERLDAFCAEVGAEAGESHRDAGEQAVVVTATTSRDPVLRGEWLRPGALVCAVGANRPEARELDNAVLERAAFVCCDSLETARLEAGDLIEPVSQGVLDWLEVHHLHDVVSGELTGRQSDEDVIVFKSNGIAIWDVAVGALALERAREHGAGVEL